MHLRVEDHGNWQICSLSGAINASNSDKFSELFLQTMAKCNKNLIVNLKELDFIDSKGISAFIIGKKVLAKNGLSICISNVPSPVRKILNITFIDNIIPIYEDIAQVMEVQEE
ncbi:STAS domain-containing protein [bacterium]|nr:STAS domain-containing protein [bacterium]